MKWAGCVLAIAFSCFTISVANGETYTPGQKPSDDFNEFAQEFIANNCVDCHGEVAPEADLMKADFGLWRDLGDIGSHHLGQFDGSGLVEHFEAVDE